MVGLNFALLLAKQCPDLKIAVIESFGLSAEDGGAMLPSFDARSTALSESSRLILEEVGLWRGLQQQVCGINTIHVSDRGHPGATRMTAQESGLGSLGYVVENRVLGRVLMSAIGDRSNIDVIAPARVEKLTPVAGGMAIQLAARDEPLAAGLSVVADGANSGTLQGLGIHTRIREYGQVAVIANVGLSQPHGGIAYERFTDEGPIALLPLLPCGQESRAALVWTLPQSRAEAMVNTPEVEFLQTVQQRFGFRAGRFSRCGSRYSYPLKLMVAEEQVRSHLVVVGNAAHFLHPVAGQGFNLALRDVSRLAGILAKAHRGGELCGSLSVLQRYQDAQKSDQFATIGFSHSLPKVFGLNMSPGIALRNAGLIALDLLPAARQEFARFGAGLANPSARHRP
jgi:2-polyprenyl-6-methoxyphenol 4-hydroxylase